MAIASSRFPNSCFWGDAEHDPLIDCGVSDQALCENCFGGDSVKLELRLIDVKPVDIRTSVKNWYS